MTETILTCHLIKAQPLHHLLILELKNYNIVELAIEIKIGECKTKTAVVFVFYSSHKIPPSNSLFPQKYKDSGVDTWHLDCCMMTFSRDLSLLVLLSTFLVWLTSKRSRFLWWVEVTREDPNIWAGCWVSRGINVGTLDFGRNSVKNFIDWPI